MYDNKIGIVIKDDLLTWQKLNVVSFLSSAVDIQFSDTHGKDFTADNIKFLHFLKHPILVYKAETQEKLQRAFHGQKTGNFPSAFTQNHFLISVPVKKIFWK